MAVQHLTTQDPVATQAVGGSTAYRAFARDSRVRYVLGVVALMALYYGSAQLSYSLNFAVAHGNIVWLPAGVGIAFLYLAGMRFWPGILVGDLITTNLLIAGPVGSRLGVTFGDVLQVLIATLLLRRLARRGPPLGTARGVAGMAIAIAVGVTASATIGALSLRLGGVFNAAALPGEWRLWWLGDFCGAMILVPVALAWYPWPHIELRRQSVFGAILPLAAVVGLSALVWRSNRPSTYLVFPALAWSALRIGQRGATLAVLVASSFAVWATAHLYGPFHGFGLTHSVLETQLYIAVASFSTLCLAAIVNERDTLGGNLRATLARTVETAERERRRLERDLHDGAQSRLVAASIDLSLAGELVDGDERLRERLVAATVEVEEALAELREVAHGIFPPALGRWGLARAFELLAARYRGRVTVIEADARRFAPELEAAGYYCCLEAVQNASKHAGRDVRIWIRLYTEADQLHLEVRDDGPGFDTAGAHDGIGLQNMRDRVGAVGGHVEISSRPGQGTLVTATAPVSDCSAAQHVE